MQRLQKQPVVTALVAPPGQGGPENLKSDNPILISHPRRHPETSGPSNPGTHKTSVTLNQLEIRPHGLALAGFLQVAHQWRSKEVAVVTCGSNYDAARIMAVLAGG